VISNKQVYQEAFERARSGKSRAIWDRIMSLFQDQYTQQSREQGERDGLAARAKAEPQAQPQQQ